VGCACWGVFVCGGSLEDDEKEQGMRSRVQHFVTPWTVAHQAPLSMEFPRLEYWSGLPSSSPGDLPDPGIEPASLMSTCIGR